MRPLPFRLAFDDGEAIVADLTLAAFGNTKSYGGGMLICPEAYHAYGQLDITMVHATSRTRPIRLFPTVFKGTHVELDRVTTERAKGRSASTPPASIPTPTVNMRARYRSRCPRCLPR